MNFQKFAVNRKILFHSPQEISGNSHQNFWWNGKRPWIIVLNFSINFNCFVFLFLSELEGEGHIGLRKEAVAGISTGSFVLGLLLSMILFYCYRKRKGRRRSKLRSKQGNTFPLRPFENRVHSAPPLKG